MNVSKSIKRILLRYNTIKKHPLTKDTTLAALMRYFSFNITQFIFKKPRVYNWIYGLKFYVEKGDAGLVGNIYYKLMDYEDSMFLIDSLKKDELFVDVGANLGHFSLLASGICKAKSIAIEPIKSTMDKLNRNIKLNNLTSYITLLNIGIGDKSETLSFTTNNTVMNSVSLEENSNTVKVEVKTLDQILKNENPVFIKIDVEGYEYKVLKGAHYTLSNPSLKYLLVEFNNSGSKFNFEDQAVFDLITKHNFIPALYEPRSKQITKVKTFNRDKFNTLFIKNDINPNA
ncbi:methyltransferase, FkbM family [Algibacter lectus]|uniref:FkbM family methyltransferase n=1 Tax=Algibacter lectus TaxID=221126 RepID=UPI0008EAE6B2|nr:FkbM family methyltransferase [Algibacter lectus]SFD25089.1 methyltransferase, FkbM family [Algibacter lectus]